MVTCWEGADLLALVCYVLLCSCHFPIGILCQVWCLIVSIPDLCPLSYFDIEGSLVRDSLEAPCFALERETLFSAGSTQENRKFSLNDSKIVD